MTIAIMTDGCPRVDHQSGDMVGLYSEDGPNDFHGFLLEPDTAYTLALRLLATVQGIRGDNAALIPVQSVAIDCKDLTDGEVVARLVIRAEDTEFGLFVDPTQLAELAVGISEASKAIDRPHGPGPKRGI